MSTQKKKDWQQEPENFQSTPLNADQLAEICAGKYPTNYEEYFIHLRNISPTDSTGLEVLRGRESSDTYKVLAGSFVCEIEAFGSS